MDIAESECLSKTSDVKCSLYRKVGRQRILLQRINMEAMLQGVGMNIDFNREQMLNSTSEFEQAHFDLIHGKAPHVPRTDYFCLLQQLKDIRMYGRLSKKRS